MFEFISQVDAFLKPTNLADTYSVSNRGYKHFCNSVQPSPNSYAHSFQITAKKARFNGLFALQAKEPSEVGKVLGTSSTGFDSKTITTPVVRRYVSEEGENWRMWYNGRDSDFDPNVASMATGRIG